MTDPESVRAYIQAGGKWPPDEHTDAALCRECLQHPEREARQARLCLTCAEELYGPEAPEAPRQDAAGEAQRIVDSWLEMQREGWMQHHCQHGTTCAESFNVLGVDAIDRANLIAEIAAALARRD